MAALNNSILLNNGSQIFLATFQIGEPYTGSYSISKGTNHPPTVVNMSMDVVLAQKEVVPDSVLQILQNGGNESYIASDTFKNAETTFDQNVRWLWGSLENGGCYIRKVSSNAYRVGGVTCFIYYRNQERYCYLINEQGDTRTQAELDDLTFMYDEGFITNEYFPIIYVFNSGGIRAIPGAQGGEHYWVYYVYNALTHLYSSAQPLDSMYAPTRYITWEGTLGDKPSCYWSLYGPTAPKGLSNKILGIERLTDNVVIIKGDIWGGQLADDEDDPNSDAGSSEEAGGNGDYPSETSHVDTPDASSMATNIVNSGLVTLYNPTLAGVKAFSDFLFTDIDEVKSLQLKRLIADPLDFTLFLAMCHFDPPYTEDDTIMYAGISTGVTAHKINNQFKKIDCGTVHIGGDTNTFLDYNNMTRIDIYLPYIGIQELNADDIIGSEVNCTYNIDMITGNCLVTLKCVRSVRRQQGDAELDDILYTFTGNCYESVPLTATDWRSLFTSSINLVVGGIALAGGNVAGIGAVANAIMTEKVSVAKSGNTSSNFGYMGVQYPYIIIERPVTANPYNYRAFKGQVLNMRYKLGNLSGYTEIESDTLRINGFEGITQGEAEMLKEITGSGFYL